MTRTNASLTSRMLTRRRDGPGGYSRPFVDKHSTGGIGDKISLPLAPIVAAAERKWPMMSGRLSAYGGTLDKWSPSPCYRTIMDLPPSGRGFSPMATP